MHRLCYDQVDVAGETWVAWCDCQLWDV